MPLLTARRAVAAWVYEQGRASLLWRSAPPGGGPRARSLGSGLQPGGAARRRSPRLTRGLHLHPQPGAPFPDEQRLRKVQRLAHNSTLQSAWPHNRTQDEILTQIPGTEGFWELHGRSQARARASGLTNPARRTKEARGRLRGPGPAPRLRTCAG